MDSDRRRIVATLVAGAAIVALVVGWHEWQYANHHRASGPAGWIAALAVVSAIVFGIAAWALWTFEENDWRSSYWQLAKRVHELEAHLGLPEDEHES